MMVDDLNKERAGYITRRRCRLPPRVRGLQFFYQPVGGLFLAPSRRASRTRTTDPPHLPDAEPAAQEVDGFSSGEGIIVLAATNQPDVLDRPLLDGASNS